MKKIKFLDINTLKISKEIKTELSIEDIKEKLLIHIKEKYGLLANHFLLEDNEQIAYSSDVIITPAMYGPEGETMCFGLMGRVGKKLKKLCNITWLFSYNEFYISGDDEERFKKYANYCNEN